MSALKYLKLFGILIVVPLLGILAADSMKNLNKEKLLGALNFNSGLAQQSPSRQFKEPETRPPFTAITPFLNVGPTSQTKEGALTLGAGLKPEDPALVILRGRVGIGIDKPKYLVDVAERLNSTELCIGGDCRKAWPVFTKSTLEVRQCPLVESGTACGGNTCVGQLTTEKTCQAVGGTNDWECPNECNLLPTSKNKCVQDGRCTKKTSCRQENRDCPVVGKYGSQ